MAKHGFGIDVGGTGIKGGPVDLKKGRLAEKRFRIETPQPATPAAVADGIRQVLEHFSWDGPFGCTIPAVVQHGVVRTATNIDHSWIGTDAHELLEKATGQKPLLVNDADAAGLAEVRFGAAKGHDGLVFVSTLGTGIGSALVAGGALVPNTELGHLEMDGKDAETLAAASVRERDGLSWEQWAPLLSRYFQMVENLLWPDLIVVGGGVSKEAAEWMHLVQTRTEMVPAKLLNDAGIVGAAVLADEHHAGRGKKDSKKAKGSKESKGSKGS